VSFEVSRGSVFVIMGGSGCGKSTLMRHLLGLLPPVRGSVEVGGVDIWSVGPAQRSMMLERSGVLFQSGALWSSMTIGENVALPLQEFTGLTIGEIEHMVSFKLALVGLAGCEPLYPAQLSGGMQKRAGLARALALDPEILFCDEPSAGLDPISARRLDDLIATVSRSLGTTVVMVTHELASIFAIGTDAIFLDTETRTLIAHGRPEELRASCPHPAVRQFLNGGRDGTT